MKSLNKFNFRSKILVYAGKAVWHFLALPKKESAMIKQSFHGITRGFGSLPIQVTIGKTTWETSIFPDTKRGVYILPLKNAVRKAEEIGHSGMVSFILEIKI